MINDEELLDAMKALKYRISPQGIGIPHTIPIPGQQGNVGRLKYIQIQPPQPTPTTNTSTATATSSVLSSLGVNPDATAGLVAGFEINEDELIAPMDVSSSMNVTRNFATYDGQHRLWKLTPRHRPVFLDSAADIRALLAIIRQLDFAGSDETNQSTSQQLNFLEHTLLQARQQLANDDSKVASLQLELKTLKNSMIHTHQLQKDVQREARHRTMVDRQSSINQGKEALQTILRDPITHVAAIQALVKALPSSASTTPHNRSPSTPLIHADRRPTHGAFENVVDVLAGTPAFVHFAENSLIVKSSFKKPQKPEQLEHTLQHFSGIETLAAHKMDQIFTHYIVTVVSEGGRRMEVNLSHENEHQSSAREGNGGNGRGGGMNFEQLRNHCSKYWGLVEHKFMVQTDYSMPVDELASVRNHLQHLAVSERIMWGQKPFLLDARDTFKQIDEDNSGQIDVGEFAKLFKRFSTSAQSKIVSVFAEIDVDRSGEISFAEFSLEWSRVLHFLKSDIPRNELPICYLLPKEVVAGGDGASYLGGSTIGYTSNVTGADKHIIDGGADVGNIDREDHSIDMRNSPMIGFEMFDACKDGTIDFEEFKDVFANINSLEMNDAEVKRELTELFNNTNTSRTGQIDYGEFTKNWKNILTKMADHSRVFSENEILKELAQNIGNSKLEVFQKKAVSLPMRETMMIREAFIYIVLVVLLTLCTFNNRDIGRSFYMIDKFRTHAFDDSFGGPKNGVGSSWNGNKHYDKSVLYQWNPMNQSWLPGTAPVPIGGKISSQLAAQAAAAAAEEQAALAQNSSTTSSSSSTEADSTASTSASTDSTKGSSTLTQPIRPQSFAFYESVVPDNRNTMNTKEINNYLQRQWNLNIDGTTNRISTDAWKTNVARAQTEYTKMLHKINQTWHKLKQNSTVEFSQEAQDWLEEYEKLLQTNSDSSSSSSSSSSSRSNPVQKGLNYRGVSQAYPASLLYPQKGHAWHSRVTAGKAMNSQKTSITAKIVPNYLSTIEEVYGFLKGPLRRAIVATRADEAEAMREAYLGSRFWSNGQSISISNDGTGAGAAATAAAANAANAADAASRLDGRPTPYDDEEVIGRTDIFNNSYVHLVGRPVGPGLILEKRNYINEHTCGQTNTDKTEIQERLGSLLCQPTTAEEWEQAPTSVITADVTDTYRKYKAAMIKLRTLNWLDSRNTAEIKMSGVLYNPNSNLAMSWSIHLKKATPDGTIFLFNHVNLRVIQIDQLNTAMQRTVGILSIVSLLLLGYVAKVEIDRCQRIKITSGHYRDAMRSVSLWGSVVMIVLFIVHLILRALYFFNAARRNFDITTKNLASGLPNLSFVDLFELEHLTLTIVAAISWFRMLNYLMLSSRIWYVKSFVGFC